MKKAFIFACIFLLIVPPLYASRITSAQKKIQKGDFEKAKALLDKELHKNPGSAAALQVYAVYFFSEANPDYQIDSAYFYVQKSLEAYADTDEKTLEKWAKENFDAQSAQTLKTEIASQAFQNAQIENTLQAFQYFISYYADASQISVAKTQRNLLAWEQALQQNDLQAYQAFIDAYPAAVQISEATQKRDEIIFRDQTNKGSLASYQRFVREYPNSQNLDQALKRIFYLSTLPHGIASFEGFVKNYPANSMSDFALEWLLAFYEKEQKLADFVQKYPQFSQKKRLSEMLQVNALQYVPVLERGIFGFYDEMGAQRIPFQYEYINPEYLCQSITEDYLVINRNGRLGILNKLGQEVVPPQFDKIEQISTGLFKVTKNAFSGLVHQSGREILPTKYDAIEVLNADFLKVRQNRLWGLSSYSGESIVEPKYTEIEPEEGGFVLFRLGDLVGMASNEAIFEMNSQQNIRIQADLNEIKVLDEGKFLHISRAGKQGIIDRLGRAVIPLQMDKIQKTPQGWVALKDSLWQVYQQNGAWIEQFKFENIDFGGQVIAGKKQGKWGIINMNAETVVDFKYDSIAFIAQTAFLFEGKKVKAAFLQNPKASEVDFTYFRGMRAEKGNYPNAETLIYYEDRQGKKGLFDQNGKKILSPKYSSVYALGADLINVEQYNKYGLVDSTQILVMPIRYDGIINLEKDADYKILLLNRKYGLYSKKYNLKIEPVYESRPEIFIQNKQQTLFLVSKGGKFGLINPQNKTVLPLKFDKIAPWSDSTFLVELEPEVWTLQPLGAETAKEMPVFEEVKIIKNTAQEVIAAIRQKGKWGAWSSLRGEIIPAQYDLIENRGISERPILFGEKRQENNQIEVTLHNYLGSIIWRSLLSRNDYYKMLCE